MSVKFHDYYELLGVPRTATREEIRKAFRKLARLYHPDVAKDKKTAESKFKEINEAYEVLNDPEKRKKYDALGADWQHGSEFRPPPGWENVGQRQQEGGFPEGFEFHFGGTGFSDFFETLFGSAGSGPSRTEQPFGSRKGFSREQFSQQGRDVEADILVRLDEVLKGSTRKITLQRNSARGRSPSTETYQVKIPHGIREGQRIRLAGQGEPGAGQGKAGDLFLRVHYERHPDFRVQGSDLYCELELAPWEAVLGCIISLSTLEGHVSLKVPPNTSAGQNLRLKGLGLPQENGKRGDLYATAKIQVPTQITSKEEALWKELAKLSEFNPRK